MGVLHSQVDSRGKPGSQEKATPRRKKGRPNVPLLGGGDHLNTLGRGVVLTPPPGRGQDLACWDLKSRPGLGAGIDARDWGLCSQLDIPDSLDIGVTEN
ncbi:hypothetical protein ACRRTK_012495 [Alexandromys fortis]